MQRTARKRKGKLVKRIKNVFMGWSRRQKLKHFYSLYTGGAVLDVGVSGEQWLPAVNLFLNTFPLPGRYYTGLGIDDLTKVAALHPGKRFVRYTGGKFPFGDDEFAWVFSNAVIEHVGAEQEQSQFILEMLRVGRMVFFTTPNKFFLFETHTSVPLLHWHNGLLDLWCARYRPYHKGNLHLLSHRKLQTLVQKTGAYYRIYRNYLTLPVTILTPTFTVVCSKTVRDWDSIGPRKVCAPM